MGGRPAEARFDRGPFSLRPRFKARLSAGRFFEHRRCDRRDEPNVSLKNSFHCETSSQRPWEVNTVQRQEKEAVVMELEERLRSAETLIVANYRGLSVIEMDNVRTQLLAHGATFRVVKNSLTRRAAEGAGVSELNEFIDGPSAIVFLAEGDVVGVAKTLKQTAQQTKILSIRGGLLEGQPVTADQVIELASLPPADVLRGQILGAVVAPMTGIVALLGASMRELVGVFDARVRQLEEQGAEAGAESSSDAAEPDTALETEVEAESEGEPKASSDAEAPSENDGSEEPESQSGAAKEESENGD